MVRPHRKTIWQAARLTYILNPDITLEKVAEQYKVNPSHLREVAALESWKNQQQQLIDLADEVYLEAISKRVEEIHEQVAHVHLDALLIVNQAMLKRLQEDIDSFSNSELTRLARHLANQLEAKVMEFDPHRWASVRFHVLQRDSFTCRYCGRSPLKNADVELHVDHIQPRSAGGDDSVANLLTACSACNMAKSGTVFEERILQSIDAYISDANEEWHLHDT